MDEKRIWRVNMYPELKASFVALLSIGPLLAKQ
jgi:hypothetical protein